MVVEEYIESLIIRQDDMSEAVVPSFNDTDIDEDYEIDAVLILKQIIKSVQNKTHNKHDYVFQVKEIRELKKVE
jgi:hypothetical protein